MTAIHPATRPAAPRRTPVVVGLGGNALRRDVAAAVESIADLAGDHDVVVTHGEAPQGAIAHQLEHGLSAVLPGREVAAVHLHSVVDATELRTIRWLMAEGALVICGGECAGDRRHRRAGGRRRPRPRDRAARGLPGRRGPADAHRRPCRRARLGHAPRAGPARATPADLRSMAFADGSMRPKVHAACRFVEATGGVAAIGTPADARALLDGRSGTTVQTTHGRLWADCDAARHRLSLVPAAVARSLDASPEGVSV